MLGYKMNKLQYEWDEGIEVQEVKQVEAVDEVGYQGLKQEEKHVWDHEEANYVVLYQVWRAEGMKQEGNKQGKQVRGKQVHRHSGMEIGSQCPTRNKDMGTGMAGHSGMRQLL